MTLNVISNFAANNALRNLGINGNEASKSVSRLSSGARVTSAADDAAALSIGTRINTEVKSLEQATINASQAISLLQIADGGLSQIQELLTRAKVLAVQAGAENISDTERALLDTEFQNLKLEIQRIAKDTKFNSQSVIGEDIVITGTDITAANTIANTGLGALDGLSEAIGNTDGVVDLALRGIDNRSVTAGGDGAFIVTIYQGEVTISDSTGQSFGPFTVSNGFNAATGAAVVVQTNGVPAVAGATTYVFADTEQTQSTQFNPVAFNAGGSLDYNSLRTDVEVQLTEQQAQYGYVLGAATTVGNTIIGISTIQTFNIATTDNGIQPVVVNNPNLTGAFPAEVGSDLIFTAFFEFGDLDGDGNNDVIIKQATIDGALLVDAGDVTADDVTIATGVTLNFNNESADFSSAGGISDQTQRNAGISIVLDPNLAGANFNLGVDAGGDIQGLFAANAQRFAQATVDAANGSSSVADFDFKVGTGILADEDEINVRLGGVTLDQLGVENAEIRTRTAADASNQAIDAALDFLVAIRADVGASINRLEVAADNVGISIENLEASRSRLLDLSVAEEITAFTSKQLLLQTGTSVLAQANQLPQNLLRLYS